MDATIINTVSGIGSQGVSSVVGLSTGKAVREQRQTSPPLEDTLDESAAEMARSQADVQVSSRLVQIYRARTEIEAAEFLTPERMDQTVERLIGILGLAIGTERQPAQNLAEARVKPGARPQNEP